MFRRQARKAMQVYEKLLSFLFPDLFIMTLQATTTFFTEARIWNIEFFCAELLKRFLTDPEHTVATINVLLSKYTVL